MATLRHGAAEGEKTVKIGIGAPLTAGSVAQGQGIQRGVELAVKQANESEELKALKIKLVTVPGDDQGDPKTGVTVANTFASDRSLLGVVGHLNSGVTIPASKVYNEAKIAMISPAATNPALTLQGLNNVFRVCTIDSVQGPTGADAAFNEVGAQKVVVIDDSTPYGEGLADEFAKQFAANGGEVLFTEKTSDKDTDFNALVTKIKAADPDLVYYGGTYNAGALLSKQMSESGVKAPLMGGDGLFDAQYIKLAGAEAAQGDLVTSVGLPTDKLPKGQEFTAAYKAEFPNDEVGAYDAYSYDAANVLIAAIVAAAKEQGRRRRSPCPPAAMRSSPTSRRPTPTASPARSRSTRTVTRPTRRSPSTRSRARSSSRSWFRPPTSRTTSADCSVKGAPRGAPLSSWPRSVRARRLSAAELARPSAPVRGGSRRRRVRAARVVALERARHRARATRRRS